METVINDTFFILWARNKCWCAFINNNRTRDSRKKRKRENEKYEMKKKILKNKMSKSQILNM